jgi:hypothetical protein
MPKLSMDCRVKPGNDEFGAGRYAPSTSGVAESSQEPPGAESRRLW